MIGQLLSRFEILSRILESPTGDVYKARDTQTGGLFAIKILPSALTGDPDRSRRIEEAVKTAAAISHPNLARAYELATADGMDFVVSELVEGESLDHILRRERLHRKDLYAFARQIAAALDAGHAAGLVHGGLCGACVLLDRQGRIKVLDCGLARVLQVSEDDTPPEIACYHSPEQVEGKELDERSDVFSFGALLYYMSTRRRPFRRETLEATRLAILREEPKPFAAVTGHPPRGIEKIVKRCLRKDPSRRYQRIADVAEPIEKVEADYRSGNTGRSSRQAIPTKVLTGLLAVTALSAVAGILYWVQNVASRSRRDDASQITLNTGFDSEPAISNSTPEQVAYASDQSGDGNLDIWIQPVSGIAAVRLTRDPADDHEPAISLDGSTVAFRSERAGGGVYVVPSSGGDARLLAAGGRRPRYSPDGTQIAYWSGQADGVCKLYVIPAEGGKPRQVAPGFAGAYPVWSPDGLSLLFLGNKGEAMNPSDVDWWLAPLGRGEPANTSGCHSLRQFAMLRSADCVAPGDWKGKRVYFSLPEGATAHLWREEMLSPHDLVSRPDQMTSGDTIDTQPAATADGRVLFSKQALNVDIWAAPVRANEGKLAGDWKKLTTDAAVDEYPSASADGQRLVFQSDRHGTRGAWLLNMNSRLESPVPSDRKMVLWPRISPDGMQISFADEGAGKFDSFHMPVAGGNAQRLCADCGPGVDWSHDGKRVLVEDNDTGSIAVVKIGSTRKLPVFPGTGARLSAPRFSPDEKWIAFVERIGAAGSRAFLAPLRGDSAGTSNEWLTATMDDSWEAAPQWSPDGEILYFISARDGHRCVWARRSRDVKAGSGEPFAVAHFHDARRSPNSASFHATDLFVGAGQMAISLGELSGSVYMIKPGN